MFFQIYECSQQIVVISQVKFQTIYYVTNNTIHVFNVSFNKNQLMNC